MTRAEERKMRRLEARIAELEKAITRHLDVYRVVQLENIEMRARMEELQQTAYEMVHIIQRQAE